MSYKFTVHGIEVTASTAAEAAALLRELAPKPEPAPAKVRILRPVQPTGAETPRMVASAGGVDAVLSFLEAIYRAPKGIGTADLMPILGVEHPKGVGSRTALFNGILRQLGFSKPFPEVYSVEKTPSGRVFYPGPELRRAIETLERASNRESARGREVPR